MQNHPSRRLFVLLVIGLVVLPFGPRAVTAESVLIADRSDSEATTATERVFNFPDDKSYGRIYTARVGTDFDAHWPMLCEARGEVVIPAGHWVRLSVAPDCPVDPSPFEFVGPDDIYWLDFNYDPNPLQEPGALRPQNIARILSDLNKLTGMRVLELGSLSIRDDDLRHVPDLKRIEMLSIGTEDFSDAGMEYVARYKLLRRINLTGKITDAGLNKLGALPALRQIVLWGDTKITKSAMAKFRAAHPDCTVFDLEEYLRNQHLSLPVAQPMPVF